MQRRVRALLSAVDRLNEDLASLRFGAPVSHVYNPLVYARAAHADYLRRYGEGEKQVLFLGMNPGPFGMAQTGEIFVESIDRGEERTRATLHARVSSTRPLCRLGKARW